jgi:D-arabinitol 4-dehydrogenase
MNALNTTPLSPLNYSKTDCEVGIIHVGVGAFHRAHQAVYMNKLLGDKDQQKWGIIGINLRSQDAKINLQLADQKHVYTLKTLSPDNQATYQEIGSILSTLDWSTNPEAAAQAVDNENIHLITMTVTESGYYLSENGQLETQSPIIVEALTGSGSCIYAYLRASLNARRFGCNLPITLLCCDNLRDNGHYLKLGFEQFLAACNDTHLLEWIASNVTFPCCMVDRITPRSGAIHIADVKQKFGLDDPLTIMSESYTQWVIEDNFAGPKPDFERVGVELTADVSPYEDAKIRILNGGHTILAYFAALKGYITYDQGLADEELNTLFSAYVNTEVIPAIGESPLNLNEYYQLTKTRLSNSNIADDIARICADGGVKFPIFILPTLTDCYARGHTPVYALQGIASWYVFMCQVQAQIIQFDYIEPNWTLLEPLLDGQNATNFIECEDLWGQLPVQFPLFKQQLTQAITLMLARFPVA